MKHLVGRDVLGCFRRFSSTHHRNLAHGPPIVSHQIRWLHRRKVRVIVYTSNFQARTVSRLSDVRRVEERIDFDGDQKCNEVQHEGDCRSDDVVHPILKVLGSFELEVASADPAGTERGSTDIGRPGRGRPGLGRHSLGWTGLGRAALGRTSPGRTALGRTGLCRTGLGRPALGRPALGRPALGRTDLALPNVEGATGAILQASKSLFVGSKASGVANAHQACRWGYSNRKRLATYFPA